MRKKLFFILILIAFFTFNLNIKANAASNLKAGLVATSGGNLNIRTSPSSSSTIKTTVANNTYLTLISQQNNWWYVQYQNGQYGYCHSNYITPLWSSYQQSVKTNGGNLNVRSSASSNSSVITTLKNNTTVVVLNNTNGFSKVVYNGNRIGYMSSNYLGNVSNTYTKKTLSIPSFKQYDSRWASALIGSSGQTMKQIGCTTTTLAMTESFRQGKTITPYDMKNKLSYTSGGALYWPSNYTSYTNSNYLLSLYNSIQNGKPVIISFGQKSGKKHWVVVTGYKGNSNTLNANDFLINDPGSSTRSTLQGLINDYPIFYKYVTYN